MTRIGTGTGTSTAPTVPRPRSTPALVIASVPGDHVYVRHLAPPDTPGPRRVAPAGDLADWLATADVDVLHVQAGLGEPVPDARAVMRALRHSRTPLVVTVHDPDDASLDLLLPASDAVIALTPDVADEVRRRWGRDALVVAHPHVVPLGLIRGARSMRDVRRRGGRALQFRVGLLVEERSAEVRPALVDAVRPTSGTLVPVDPRRIAGGDESLWAHLASLDALVLPHGTTSPTTWLEACRDLGTTVVAPVGLLPDQAAVLTYGDAGSGHAGLSVAVHETWTGHPAPGPEVELRRQQRAAIAAVHEQVYRSVIAHPRRTS